MSGTRSGLWIATAVLVLIAVLLAWYWVRTLQSPPEALVDLDCPEDLVEFVACVRQHMPRRDSKAAFALPDVQALSDLAGAASALVEQAGAGCGIELPGMLGRRYRSVELVSGGKRYCALWEAHRPELSSSPLGWGTLVVNPNPQRALVMGAPHPLFDIGTMNQALELFVELEAQALVMAGSHRHAAPASGPGCQRYASSDASHSASGYFALASGVMASRHVNAGKGWFVEWHGMRAAPPDAPCHDPTRNRPLDVYITEGSAQPLVEGGFATRLVAAVRARQPGWIVASAGEGVDCDKNGASNVLGKTLNGLGGEPLQVRACDVSLPVGKRATGRFVHVEQLQCPGGVECDGLQRIRSASGWSQSIRDAYAAAVGDGAGTGAGAGARDAY